MASTLANLPTFSPPKWCLRKGSTTEIRPAIRYTSILLHLYSFHRPSLGNGIVILRLHFSPVYITAVRKTVFRSVRHFLTVLNRFTQERENSGSRLLGPTTKMSE